MQTRVWNGKIALAAFAASSLLAGAARAAVLAPDAPVAGASQAVWGDRWWQWAISFPNGQNPLTDPTGALSGVGDQGPVFFLAGTVTGPANRTATVRADQTLFIPIGTAVSPIPLFGNDEAAVRADAAATLGPASGLFLTVDGAPAALPAPTSSLLDFHQVTPPGTFPLTIPDNNIYGVPVGTFQSVEDGYWVMLDGLSVGTHTVHFGGHFDGTPALNYAPFDVDNTYTLTVVPVPEPTGLALFMAASVFALARFRKS